MNYRCPHCDTSLRFRRVPRTGNGDIRRCPVCEGEVIWQMPPARRDNWLWSRFQALGLVVLVIAVILDFHPPTLLAGTALYVAGFVVLLGYVIRENLRWRMYRAADEPPDDAAS
ncbi:MAG: hypothetical protein Q8J78_08250 [Moraxellaceae bacterium]|nr:hypothetical protein [Moraxellaceae bacterium]